MIKAFWWLRKNETRIVSRICTGCSHSSLIPIPKNYMTCCPDNNYKIISIKPKTK